MDEDNEKAFRRKIDQALSLPQDWAVKWKTQHVGVEGGKRVDVCEERTLTVAQALPIGRLQALTAGVFNIVTEGLALEFLIGKFGAQLVNIKVGQKQRRYSTAKETSAHVLQYVRENPGLSANEVAEGCHVAYVTALTHLRDLHQRGLVFWTAGGENGRRLWKVMDDRAVR